MRLRFVSLWLATLTLAGGQTAPLNSANNGQVFRGTLLDAPCADAIKVDSSLNNGSLDRDKAPASSPGQTSGRARTKTAGELIPCQASITSTAFAIKTDDGRVLRFDAASNGILLTQIERDPKWKDALSAVSGSPNDGGTGSQDRTAGKDVTASGVTKKAGTARMVEATGSLAGSTLHVDSVRLRNPETK